MFRYHTAILLMKFENNRAAWSLALLLCLVLVAGISHTILDWQRDRELAELGSLPPTGAGVIDNSVYPTPLFKELGAAANEWSKESQGNTRQKRVRFAGIALEGMRADALEIKLFDDTTLTAVRDRYVAQIMPVIEGGQAWVGHVKDEPGSEVVLVTKGNLMSGTIDVDAKSFEIMPVKEGVHAIREIDNTKTPTDFEPPSPEGMTLESDQPIGNADSTAINGSGNVIDVLIGYTPGARIRAGGVSAMEARILNAVMKTQQAFLNSEVLVRLNMVGLMETDYTETGSMAETHARLKNDGDGFLDELHQMRDRLGADVVVLFSTDANHCGLAPIMVQPSSAFESNAFIVVHDDSKNACLGQNNALAHEFGHLLGLAHEMDNSSLKGASHEAYGYRVCGVFRDIMASACAGEPRVPYYSNPNIMYLGQPTGVSGSIDAVRVMNASSAVVAHFRSSPSAEKNPVPPLGLQARRTSGNGIALVWSDRASNEGGYTVERSAEDEGLWTEIANLAGNSGSFVDTNIQSGKRFEYRVRAWNSRGYSKYSNIVKVDSGMIAPAVAVSR